MPGEEFQADFQISLDEETTKKFFRFLKQEGLTQAGFEARESGGSGVVLAVRDETAQRQ